MDLFIMESGQTTPEMVGVSIKTRILDTDIMVAGNKIENMDLEEKKVLSQSMKVSLIKIKNKDLAY